MRNSTFFARFAQHLVLFSTCLALTSCTSKAPSENGANEGDGGIADDQTCPGEGCETDIVCASDRDCPSDDRCRPHWCHTGSATCRWQLLDRDGDGFVPEVCGGRDCDDTPGNLEDGYSNEGCRGQETHPGAKERCDGRDNDCDGEVDDLPKLGEPCDGRDSDLCEEGVWVCEDDGDYNLECTDYTDDIRELCDGEDNDCDGEVDEDWWNLNQSCDGADADECTDGLWVCNASGTDVLCTDDATSTDEVCNGIDDDCDREVDEDLGGDTCNTGEDSICIDGTPEVCQSCTALTNVGCDNNAFLSSRAFRLPSNSIDSYGECGSGADGPELVISISNVPEDGELRFTLEILGDNNLNFFLIPGGASGACIANNCTEVGIGDDSTKVIETRADGSDTYYAIIEAEDESPTRFIFWPCTTCGNGLCETEPGRWESCNTCPSDCGLCECGNDICETNETCFSCPPDCGDLVECGELIVQGCCDRRKDCRWAGSACVNR